jgi:tetratricopeptide (TPR) repeat protein
MAKKKRTRAQAAPETEPKSAPRTPPEPIDLPAVIPADAGSERSAMGARIAIVLGTLAAFVGVLDNELLTNWDDERFFGDIDVVQPSVGGFFRIFSEIRFDAFHPLHLLSYWIDVPWVGTEGPFAATVIHAVSLAMWIGVLLVAFEVMRKLGLSALAACVGTLAFGIHPLTVEVVAWASCRKDILAMGFSLAALWAHLETGADPLRDRRSWLARLFFLLAALSKTSVLPLPLVLLALDLWTRRRTPKAAVMLQVPALLLALALGVVVIAVWSSHDMIRNTGTDAAPFELALIPATAFHLLSTSVFPVGLSAIYPLLRHAPVPGWYGLAAIGALALGLVLAYRARANRTAQRIGFGLSWFVLFALPVLNVIPTFLQWQDRYGVAALFGLALCVGAIVEHLRQSRARETGAARALPSLAVAAAVLLPLGWTTTYQVETWQDGAHLWGHATRRHPRAYYAWVKLGEVRRNRGDIDGAIGAYAHAIEVAPELRLAHAGFLYALALRDEARHDIPDGEALLLSQRYAMNADDPSALRSMAGEMVEDGYRDAATYVLSRSLDIDPVSDERIERAVSFHIQQGSVWLARFYLSRLRRRPVLPDVTAFWDAERERTGRLSDEEIEDRIHDESEPDEAEPEMRERGPVVIPIGD